MAEKPVVFSASLIKGETAHMVSPFCVQRRKDRGLCKTILSPSQKKFTNYDFSKKRD